MRQAIRNKLQQKSLREEENRKTSDAAEHEEQQTLRQQLADKPRSCRSHRLAHRDLTPSRARPGKQQVGDADATDQQDQPHRAKHQNQRLANAADRRFAERNQAHRPCRLRRILLRILLFQRSNQRIEARLRGRNRETGRQPRGDRSIGS